MICSNKKLNDAVQYLIFRQHFFSSIVLQQKFVSTTDLPTMAVDGTHLFYNDAFVEKHSHDELVGTLIHEVSHLLNFHHTRMGNRDIETWNEACDYAINPGIIKSGFKLPSGVLIRYDFANKKAEDIYGILMQEKQNQNKNNSNNNKNSNNNSQNQQNGNSNSNGNGNPSNQGSQGNSNSNGNPSGNNNSNGNGNGNPSPNFNGQSGASNIGGVMKPANKTDKEQEAATKSQIERAIRTEKMFSKGSNSSAATDAISRIPARYDWRDIVNRFVQDCFPIDYSWNKPNTRYLNTGFILPSIDGKMVNGIAIAVDTSGSISKDQVNAIVSEVFNALLAVQESNAAFELPVIFCDQEVTKVQIVFSNSDKVDSVGGRGTSFKPVFEYIETDKDSIFSNLRGLIYITDGICHKEDIKTPEYSTLWAITTREGMERYSRGFGEDMYFDIFQ